MRNYSLLLAVLFALIMQACGQSGHENLQKVKSEDVSVSDSLKVVKSESEWKAQLTDMQYYVTREAGTEYAFSGEYWDHKEDGVYTCICCSSPLFDSKTKYKSGTGWPSYYEPVDSIAIGYYTDYNLGYERVEVTCDRCDAHLGHVFPDGPEPTGLRYCINSAALDFEKR